ncbi:hypothetical protein DFJ73DRAFT_214901 [Zopfochytrium polystomum]|nr:hypothetical protein DFJ73DRAFT_214901 [Zopfochytrium polystomum]
MEVRGRQAGRQIAATVRGGRQADRREQPHSKKEKKKMWVLEGLTGQIAGTRILLRPAAQCVVGRERDCAVCLDKDMSVSRTHAKFEVHQGSAPGKSTLVVTDSSRFGTFVGASGGSGSTAEAAAATIKIAEPAQLHDGDVVAFGSKTTSLRVLYVPIRVAFSGVKGKLKQELLDIAKANEFCDDCDYLVVSTLKVTVKVVLAVALRRAIVSYEWLQALRDGTTIPDPSRYAKFDQSWVLIVSVVICLKAMKTRLIRPASKWTIVVETCSNPGRFSFVILPSSTHSAVLFARVEALPSTCPTLPLKSLRFEVD